MNMNTNINNTNGFGYNSTLTTPLVSSHGVKCRRIIPLQSNTTGGVPPCDVGNGTIGRKKKMVRVISSPVPNVNSDVVLDGLLSTLPTDSKQQEKHEKKQIYQGENKGKDEQWVDNEDATLLILLREQIESIDPDETETPPQLPKRNLSPLTNNQKVSDDDDIGSFADVLTPIPAIKPVSSVLDFVNHALDMHDFMQKWALERQEILRSEEHAFMSLLLQLQQSLILGLMHHVSLVKKYPKDFLISPSSSPPPTIPPPNTQSTSISPYNAMNDHNEYGRENDRKSFIQYNDSFNDKKMPFRQTTGTKSLYIKRFLYHEDPSNETNPICLRNSNGVLRQKKQNGSKERAGIDRGTVVEYLGQLSQPAFDSGALSAAQMGEIVKRVPLGLHNGNSTSCDVADAEWKHHLRLQVGKLLGEAPIGKT
ncbi:hypothetical protein LSM04_007565 [Trypanosoma melophagium]|uniref:uncharacterized protein n=1 Tax=Trypanosoma melophagium TaxID=715481 RepID=UPI00351A6B7F|nr:hypothetical protein LSM04_007565 [Trypanosoma melophagium]